MPSGRLAAEEGAMRVGVDEGEDMMGTVYEPPHERDLYLTLLAASGAERRPPIE